VYVTCDAEAACTCPGRAVPLTVNAVASAAIPMMIRFHIFLNPLFLWEMDIFFLN
jgi:hypothetical protein